MIQNITVRIHPEWSGKISELSKTTEEMLINPGVTENSAILSKDPVTLKIIHPYKDIGVGKYLEWKNLEPTDLKIEPYSLCAKPYAWLMFDVNPKSSLKPKKKWDKYGITIERQSEKNWYINGSFDVNFVAGTLQQNRNDQTGFLQRGEDQREVFQKFFKNVVDNKSLCFVYAKRADFTEKTQRILVGIGRILHRDSPPKYDGNNPIDCNLWETRLQHSICATGDDCVLLPYDELQEYAKDKEGFNIDDYVVFASDDFRDEYSYGTEWLSYDGAIDTILRTKESLKKIEKLLDKDYSLQQKWLDSRLEEIYEDRWIYPGLGEMLYAFGVKSKWQNVADKAIEHMKVNRDPFGEALRRSLKECMDDNSEVKDFLKKWNIFPENQKALFELLSRMSLNEIQADDFVENLPKVGYQWKKWVHPEEFIANPYLIYELFPKEDIFPFALVDNAMYPCYVTKDGEEMYEPREPSKMKDSEDLRRTHALVVKKLKEQTEKGNSLYPAQLICDDIAGEILSVQCIPGFSVFEKDEFVKISDTFEKVSLSLNGNDSFGFQLKVNSDCKKVICNCICEWTKTENKIEEDWDEICANLEDKTENQGLAKQEKRNILPMMAQSKFFILTGGAGTGKTKLLSLLASLDDVQNGKVLALAPTGKAMVRLRESFQESFGDSGNIKFQTIASFLLNFRRFNPVTGKYDHLKSPGKDAKLPDIPDTIIVDESSMLTEEMLAALFVTISDPERNCAERVILSGDANQLPPIGCGRPFLDILTLFKKKEYSAEHPYYGPHFGELQISMRQDGENRSDLAFAQCFKSSATRTDLKFFKQDAPNDDYLKIKQIEERTDLDTCIFDAVSLDLCDGSANFLVNSEENIDDWEILSPTRNDKFGSLKINEIIRKSVPIDSVDKSQADNGFIPIRVGEKIICTQNKSGVKTFDADKEVPNAPERYVANGDIGFVNNINEEPRKKYEVIYKGQAPYYHKYSKSDFKNEAKDENLLEFAYALTVHKSQGSQFKKTLVVLNKYSPMLSRELLYTAFSRQQEKLVVLFNDDFRNLKKFCNYTYSAVAKRLTNLFEDPKLITEDGVCYDEIYTKQDAAVSELYKERIQEEKQVKNATQGRVENTNESFSEKPMQNESVLTTIFKKLKSLLRHD